MGATCWGMCQAEGTRQRSRVRKAVGLCAHLKRITPSGLNDCQGCRLISTMRSVFSDLCGACQVRALHGVFRKAKERNTPTASV